MTNRVSVLVMADAKLPLDPRRCDVKVGAGMSRAKQVVVAATDRALGAEHASRLRDFVRRGGGLVLIGGTLAAWSDAEPIRELAGWLPSGPGPLTELIVRPDP